MTATAVPEKTTVLVIGGGPAGSYASTVLSREGIDVVVLEAAKFPRYHVGEGMLPSMRHYLRFIGLEEKFAQYGFMHKPGACFKLNQDREETYTDFSTLGPGRTTWNVIRSESDELMLRHAAAEGVHVFEETRVNAITFEGDPKASRPTSASWTNQQGQSGEIKFDWLVDASGRNGVMEQRYLKNRIYREGLRNVAVWGYWKDVKVYKEGTKRSNSPWIEAMTDEQGWAWLIPLHDGTTSIGIVMHQEASKRKKAEYPGGSPSLNEHYLDQIKLFPGVLDLLGEKGNLIPGSVKASSDFSYFADRYSGDHYRIIGDAACFIDPFFSSGVHLAMTAALSAASTICASMRGHVTETEAQEWHNLKVGICHTRFLLVVLSAYKQMHEQSKPILSDIDEENFDKAFNLFKPIIQGIADSESNRLTDKSLEGMIDFCIHLFDPTSEEQDHEAAEKYKPDLLNIFGPPMAPEQVDSIVDAGDDGAKSVLKKANALKILRNDTSYDSFGKETLNGYVVQLARGELGLIKA